VGGLVVGRDPEHDATGGAGGGCVLVEFLYLRSSVERVSAYSGCGSSMLERENAVA